MGTVVEEGAVFRKRREAKPSSYAQPALGPVIATEELR